MLQGHKQQHFYTFIKFFLTLLCNQSRLVWLVSHFPIIHRSALTLPSQKLVDLGTWVQTAAGEGAECVSL